MLLMSGNTMEKREQLSHHPLKLEFRVGKEIVELHSNPKPGDYCVVTLKADGKTGDCLWAFNELVPGLPEVLKAYCDLPQKQIVIGQIITANKIDKADIWSVVLMRNDDVGEDYYIHYFGNDGYSIVTLVLSDYHQHDSTLTVVDSVVDSLVPVESEE
jgi:hypothetical protein